MTISRPSMRQAVERIEVRAAETRQEWEAVFALRRQVFKIELGMAGEAVEDAEDGRSVVALALLEDDDGAIWPVGSGRLTLGAGQRGEGIVTWVATASGYRGRGIGVATMRFLLDEADRMESPAVILAAQAPAVLFYRKLGFIANGKAYIASGIEHLPMIRPRPAWRRTSGTGHLSAREW